MLNLRLNEILEFLPQNIRFMMKRVFESLGETIQEIRLRNGLPLIAETLCGSFGVLASGEVTPNICNAYIVKNDDIRRVFSAVCENSIYAFTDDIRQGFITIKGGHRVGITGRAAVNNGRIETFKEVSSLNIRIAKEIPGAADGIIDFVHNENKVKNTLIVAPPMGGKTTVLRDLARQLSDRGVRTSIADERGEIAAVYKGVPQNNVGMQTDVLDSAPKAETITMLLRCMSPQLIVTDEISTARDIEALSLCFGSGVSVIATAHGQSAGEVLAKPLFLPLFGKYGFEQIIALCREDSGEDTKIVGKVSQV